MEGELGEGSTDKHGIEEALCAHLTGRSAFPGDVRARLQKLGRTNDSRVRAVGQQR